MAAEANRRLAEHYSRQMGVPADLLLPRTQPFALRTMLLTPIPLSLAGGLVGALALVWLAVPWPLALPLGYLSVTVMGYALLRLAGERGMAMGARAVTYTDGGWTEVETAMHALAPSLYHGWTHLAGRAGCIRLHNSLAVAAAYLAATQQGDSYRIRHFVELEQTVAAGRAQGGWSDLERDVVLETRGPIGWLREWTKYQYLGHSRKAYVFGGLIAGRALALAEATGTDPWCFLRAIAAGERMAEAERHLRTEYPASCS